MDKRKRNFREKMREISSSKYRIRILLTFFAVAVIAIGVIDMAVFQGLYSYIREGSEKEIRAMLHNLNESYENQLSQYQSQSQILYRNANIKAYLISKGREDSHINSIYESMRAMAGNTQGITSVILFHEDEVLASYDTGMIGSTVKEEIIRDVRATTSDKELLFCYTDVQKYKKHIVIFCTERDYLYGPGSYGVVLVVSLDEIQDKILPWNRNAETPIYIFHEDGVLVAAQNDKYKDSVLEMADAIISGESQGNSWKGVIEGKQRTASYEWAEDGSFFALKIQDMAFGQKEAYKAMQTIFISTILGMVVIMVMAWFLSGRLYRPLGEIFKNILAMAQSEEEAEWGKDELTLAADALQDVNQNMIFLKAQIRSNAVIRFLRQSGKGESIEKSLFDFGALEPTVFEILAIRYWLDDWGKNEALLTYLGNMKPDYGNSVKYSFQCYKLSQGNICILCAMEQDSQFTKENARNYAERILEELESLYQIKGCIGIARCEKIEQLPDTYKRAEHLTEYHILSKDICIMDEELMKQKQKGPIEEEEKEIILGIIKNNHEGNLLESIHKLLKNLTLYESDEVQKYLNGLVADVIRLSESVSPEKKEDYEMYLGDFLLNQIFIGQVDIEEWLYELFSEVENQLKNGREVTSMRIMERVIEHIEENYWNCELSVETVADRYGFSLSYFSKLFNSYTGKTFPDYMNQLRLQIAKELLQDESQMSIQEIGKKVGFNSSSYFSAAFRKYYGVSPSQIRKIRKKE
ncbi:AraC family transcriptional regulator [Lachnospiraceae bacterium OttesenSCG-928-D06]|nr:AraC family transcriptional regulator [Lachnospiraceae bacterium OttesenSCG-928-D06]